MPLVPWKLQCDFNALSSLFHDQDLSYVATCFRCSCGENHIFMETLSLESDGELYSCKRCGNWSFYEGENYVSEATWYHSIQSLFPQEVLEDIVPKIHYDETTQEIICEIAIELPHTIDLVREKMLFRQKKLFELRITRNGEIIQKTYVNFDLEAYFRKKQLYYDSYDHEDLIDHCELLSLYKTRMLEIIKNKHVALPVRFAAECQSLKEVAFFLQYPHLGDYELIKWSEVALLPPDATKSLTQALDFVMDGRKEKSFRKAIFSHYKTKMLLDKPFSFLIIQAVAKHIKDVNIALELFHLSFDFSQAHDFDVVHIQALLDTFMQFLTQRYSQRQIATLFRYYKKNEIFWLMDTMMMLHHVGAYLEHFPKTPCRMTKIHEAAQLHHRRMMYQSLANTTFSYDEKALQACDTLSNVSVMLPMSGLELYQWGEDLHNCLAGYDRFILDKTSVIYGFFEEETLCYAVEMRKHKVVQAKAKYNRDLTSKQLDIVIQWYEKFFVMHEEMKEKASLETAIVE